MSGPDHLRLMHDESRDLAAFLEALAPADWDEPTLCDGWRVRDVVAHMAVGHTIPVSAYAAALVRHRFSTDQTSFTLAVRFADTHEPAEILDRFRAGTAGRPRGVLRTVSTRELFVDHLVHHQDIRRRLARPRAIPETRAVAALRALPRLSGRVGSRARMAGLRLVATDVDITLGAGDHEVSGPAEALVMALTGRRQAATELAGSGLPVLLRRLGDPTPTRKAVR